MCRAGALGSPASARRWCLLEPGARAELAIARTRTDPTTRDYRDRRRAEGKTDREIRRCLKRYIARRVWRLLEHPPGPEIAA